MYSRVNYTLIGVFVIVFITATISFAFWLGNRGMKDDYTLYLLKMKESVTGLSKDSGIKMKGVDIGVVKSISINPKNIEEVDIVIKIKKIIPIKEDMVGIVKMYGLTGLSYIDISGGTNKSSILTSKDNSLPIIKSGVSLISKLGTNLEDLSIKFVNILDRGQEVLSVKNIDNFTKILDNLQKVLDKVIILEDQSIKSLKGADDTLAQIKVSTKIISDDFHLMSSNIDVLSQDLHNKITPSINKFTDMTISIDKMVTTFERSVIRGDYNMQKIMQPMMIDIRELSVQIEEMAQEFEQSPNDIFFKSSIPRKGPGE